MEEFLRLAVIQLAGPKLILSLWMTCLPSRLKESGDSQTPPGFIRSMTCLPEITCLE